MMRRRASSQLVTFEDASEKAVYFGRMDDRVCIEHECWNEQRLKLIETNKQTLWYNSLQFFLSFHNCDPYAIFKTRQAGDYLASCLFKRRTGRASAPEAFSDSISNSIVSPDCSPTYKRYTMNHVKLLRLSTTLADHTRHKYTRILRYFVVYFFFKALIISTTQNALLKYELLVPRGHHPPWLSMDQVGLVTGYLGNPLRVLKDTAMLLYMGPVGFDVVCLVLLPLYYERYPINIAVLRFILNPAHELKRLDLNIKRKLDNIRMSLGVFAREREKMLLNVWANTGQAQSNRGKLSSLISLKEAKSVLEFEKFWCLQLRGYLDEFNRRLYSFRPNLFSAKYFQESTAKMSATIAGAHLVYIFCSAVLFTAMEVPPYNHRCAIHRQELAAQNRTVTFCNPIDIYTFAELIVLIELAIVLASSYVISALNLGLFSLVTANQADLIKSIQSQLVNCRELIYADDWSSVLVGKSPSTNNKTQAMDKAVRRRLELDKFRLESLVKLMVCENELRDNARAISELTVHPFYYAGGTIVFLVIVGGQFRITETQAIRRFIMIATWINVNAVAISCAHIYSRVIEFERVMWSVLAAQASNLVQYNQSNRSLSPEARTASNVRGVPGCCTFVTNLWVKFVLATSLNVQSYCARPLYVKLTYEMIIELNFFVVFIYSLSVELQDRR